MGVYERFGKRAFDLTAAGVALVVLSPLFVIVTALVRAEDGGPALFRQKRIGRHGRPFHLLKFRSMPIDTPNVPSTDVAKLRITRVGRVIRRTNIDELPQLMNVLRGEMSLVGPRPALVGQPRLVELRRSSGAHSVRPGLTGLAQVSAYDGMSLEEKARWDGEYSSRITLASDLHIMLRTVGYLFRPPPVY